MRRTNLYVPIINVRNINTILTNEEYIHSVNEYKIIKSEYRRNISLTNNIIFQDAYIHLYKLNESFKTFKDQQKYFEVFENYKNNKRNYVNNKNQILTDILNDLEKITRHKELVFASKMLNTIFDDMPIIDSHIGRIFGRRTNISSCDYDAFNKEFNNYLNTNNEANLIITNNIYNLPTVKAIDFALWMWSKLNS